MNTTDNIVEKKIAVLLSGGVDSSVVVYELARRGLKPDCFYIKIGPEEEAEWDCTSEEDLEMATAVASRYGCRLEGRDYDLIATGHYACTETDAEGRKWLVTSPDPVKDQTDFLAQIYDWQLRKALFPIGHYVKDEVREIALREHLVTARRKDSQGICFLGKVNYNDYLRRYLGERPGDVLELETGKRIGSHRGLWFHTIGQRHGLGFGGGPWYAVKKDVERNILYVSHGFEPRTAYRQDFPIHDFHFLTMPVDMQRITFKIRHTPEYHPAVLEQTGPGSYIVHAEQPIQGVAPGQFCVVYDERHHRCYGSGEITV